MRTFLITGFDAFGKHSCNPSWMAVAQLPEEIGDFHIHKLQLPTVYEEAANKALAAAEKLQPDCILCIGLAQGRAFVTPERIAVNIRDASLADNSGKCFRGAPVVSDGPAAYFATLSPEKMADHICRQGIPAKVSNTAGTFVCNDLLYSLLHNFAGTETRVGFIHVPALPEMGEPSLSLEQIVSALTAAIAACQ